MCTILIIEDDQRLASLLQTGIEEAGYHVLLAYDAEMALRLFRSHADTVSLVLSDIILPGMTGLELCKQVRAEQPNVPILMLTALGTTDDKLKAGRSSDALLKMVKNTCYVERANNESGEIPVEELVPGDIVLLSAGDMIPADLRIVETKDFFVSQSSLTGESDSIEKTPLCNADEGSVVDLDNLAYMGSNVVIVTARCIVFATGNQT